LDRRAGAPLQARIVEGGRVPATPAFAGTFAPLKYVVIRCKCLARQQCTSHTRLGGFLLVRRRIQTPSAVRSRVGEGPGGSSSALPGPPACPHGSRVDT